MPYLATRAHLAHADSRLHHVPTVSDNNHTLQQKTYQDDINAAFHTQDNQNDGVAGYVGMVAGGR